MFTFILVVFALFVFVHVAALVGYLTYSGVAFVWPKLPARFFKFAKYAFCIYVGGVLFVLHVVSVFSN
jgi:hypothetical protein